MKNKKLVFIVLGVFIMEALYWIPKKTPRILGNSTLPDAGQFTPLPPTSQNAVPAAVPNKISPEKTSKSPGQQEVAGEEKVWDMLFLTPIYFYGKAIDEKQNPVPDATVSISFVDNLGDGETHSKRSETTDTNGLFSFSGHGLGVVVNVSKTGYYRLKESGGDFGYAKEGGQINPHPDQNAPAIFILRKIGQTVPLVRLEKYIKVPKDGSAILIDLNNLHSGEIGQDDLKIEVWINDQGRQPNSNQPYDWNCRVSVPGGGLKPRLGEFDFEAPKDGYVAFDEIKMPETLGAKWRSQASRQYFLKMSDDRYARVEFQIIASDDHFVGIKSYLNPAVGLRNLEFDPVKEIKR